MTGSFRPSSATSDADGVNILFLCPHGAAKSVIANALAQRIASEQGVRLESGNAGTDPDEFVNSIAADALAERGLAASAIPRLVTAGLIERADLVVSLGCPVAQLPAVPRQFIDWSDVPDASVDVEELISILEIRLGTLIAGNIN